MTANTDSIVVSRMPLATAADSAPGHISVPIEQPVFDGTFVYWILGLLPFAETTELQFRTWAVTSPSAEVRNTSTIRLVDRDTVRLADGSEFPSWVFSANTSSGEFKMCVSSSTPYLIKQQFVPPGGDPTTVIELKRMR